MKTPRCLMLLMLGVALSAIPCTMREAAAKDCGVTVPCDCGDTVITTTKLGKFDPVIRRVCPPPVALFVANNVTLDAHSAIIRCDRTLGFTTGIEIIGDNVIITSGIIRCDDGIFGVTSGSTIQRVTTSDGILGIAIIGDNNRLLNNLCHNNVYTGLIAIGNANTLERNYCDSNGQLTESTGIVVLGPFNELRRNRAARNGGQGIFGFGGNTITTDGLNYGHLNAAEPQCEIEGGAGPYC